MSQIYKIFLCFGTMSHYPLLFPQSVTLGDEEANRRGVQKTVLERKGPSTFCSGVEIISKTELRVHCNLEATVDAILSGSFGFIFAKMFILLFTFQIYGAILNVLLLVY